MTASKMISGHFYCAESVKIAYLEIPKCACTSAKNLIAYFDNPDFVGTLEPFSVHTQADKIFKIIRAKNDPSLNSYFKFTFVRDPVDRFISFYRDKILTSKDEYTWRFLSGHGFHVGMSMEETLSAMSGLNAENHDPHFAPQTTFLLDGNRLSVDFIGRIERGGADWERIIRLSGFDFPVPFLNAQEKEGNLRKNMSAAALGQIRQFYARDFEILGY